MNLRKRATTWVRSAGITVALLMSGCAFTGPTAADIENASRATINPGGTIGVGSDHHITASGDYGLPAGTLTVLFGCAGEVNYRIDERDGHSRYGKCKTTGVSNTASETSVAGPGTLALAIVGVGDFVNVSIR